MNTFMISTDIDGDLRGLKKMEERVIIGGDLEHYQEVDLAPPGEVGTPCIITVCLPSNPDDKVTIAFVGSGKKCIQPAMGACAEGRRLGVHTRRPKGGDGGYGSFFWRIIRLADGGVHFLNLLSSRGPPTRPAGGGKRSYPKDPDAAYYLGLHEGELVMSVTPATWRLTLPHVLPAPAPAPAPLLTGFSDTSFLSFLQADIAARQAAITILQADIAARQAAITVLEAQQST